jgi:hypothetical protein
MQQYPKDIDQTNTVDTLRTISRLRDQDITDRNNFPNIFASGRLVGKIPTSHADVAPKDKLGDFNITTAFRYDLVSDGSGGALWVRTTVSSTW